MPRMLVVSRRGGLAPSTTEYPRRQSILSENLRWRNAMPTFTLFNNEADVRPFAAGQVIFAEGQPDDDLMYAILDGEVDIVRQQRLLETILPDDVFGEMALLDNQPRSASAIAKTDCRVAALTETRFTLVV